MIPRQFRFLDMFNEVLNEYLQSNNGFLLPVKVKNSKVERFIKKSLKECRTYPQIIRHDHIKIQGSRLTITYISLLKTYLTGSWIIYSDGRKTVAFHFPVDDGKKVMLDVYFESDPLLNRYFKRSKPITADGYIDYIQLKYFENPRMAKLIPRYKAKNASKDAFSGALILMNIWYMKIFLLKI